MRTSKQQSTEWEHVARIQAGDEEAFEALFRCYYEELCRFVQNQTGSAEVAEDLVQNIFLSLWRRRQDWEPKTTLRAYLFGAARNESIKHRKHQQVRSRWKRKEKEKAPPKKPDPVDKLKSQELKRTIQQWVNELPERRRQVYLLSRQHGLTYREIARVMDISPKTVDNQMVAALKFLRKHLGSFHTTTA
jgi:RNA polymerase sigma-70 factor (ECF subfamily)